MHSTTRCLTTQSCLRKARRTRSNGSLIPKRHKSSRRYSPCVSKARAMKRLQEYCRSGKCLCRWHIGSLKVLTEVVRKRKRIRTSGVRRPLQRYSLSKSIAAMSSTSRPTQSHSKTKPVFPIAKRIGQSSRTNTSRSLTERPLSKYRS